MATIERYGYYLFLGLGDFEGQPPLGPEWTSTWDLSAWMERIDRLVELGANTLFIYLLGHHLPYPSSRFPACVEEQHPNVRSEFFHEVLDQCVERDLYLVAVFSTTGHAKAYTARHPGLAICDRSGNPRVESGIMCHHKEGARHYCTQVIDECLDRYHGFSGVILHPPEFLQPCFCEACQESYRRIYGGSLCAASEEAAKEFFMATNLHFQRTVLEARIRRRLPEARIMTFTIPWVFNRHFAQIAKEIDPATVIVHWDYELSDERVAALPSRLKEYQQFGHEVWFMPTSGFAFSQERSRASQARAVLRQVEGALDAGVRGIVYFMGPKWWPTVEETSFFLHRR